MTEEPKRISNIFLRAAEEKNATAILTVGGYLFLGVSVIALFTLCMMAYMNRGGDTINTPQSAWDWAVAYSSHLFLLVASLLAAMIGYGLLRSAGAAFQEIIPSKDSELLYDLLRKDNSTGLDNYVKLASLSGLVGTCYKLGVTGLPLATIGLTIFFAVLGLIPNQSSTGYFDLAKLTLGAFIGSFVQRSRLKFGDDKPESPGNVS